MAQQVTQMATPSDSSSAAKERSRASFETPVRPSRGLDTGARGWRWVMATPSSRRMAGAAR